MKKEIRERNFYESPRIKVFDLDLEGMLCQISGQTETDGIEGYHEEEDVTDDWF